MNLNQILNMLLRMFSRHAMNWGINKGIDKLAKSQGDDVPAEQSRQRKAQMHASVKRIRQAARLARRIGRH